MTISVIIPVYNDASTLRRCLEGVCASRYPNRECIVVNDGSTDGSGDVARSFPVRVLELPEGPRGPAYARNRGAEVAQGEILLFVDADVVLQPDSLSKVVDTFAQHPEIAAVFGSYDDRPGDTSFLSLYKNLFHHFVHQQAREEATTFWSGCGAVRSDVFRAIGGFDEARYPRPGGEDIELGYRLIAADQKVILNKQIQVKHLKRWTMAGLLVSDVYERGIPWTYLILERRTLSNDLNLHVSQRLSAALVCLLLAYLSTIAFLATTILYRIILMFLLAGVFLLITGHWSGGTPHFQAGRRAKALTYVLICAIGGLGLYTSTSWIIGLLSVWLCTLAADLWFPRSGRPWERILFGSTVLGFFVAAGLLLLGIPGRFALPILGVVSLIVLINHRFYAFFLRQLGLLFTLAIIPFHLSYYLYSTAAFVGGVTLFVTRGRGNKDLPSSRPLWRRASDTARLTGTADRTDPSSR